MSRGYTPSILDLLREREELKKQYFVEHAPELFATPSATEPADRIEGVSVATY